MINNVVIVNDFNYIQGGASKVAIDTARLLKEKDINVYFFSAINKKSEEIEGIEYYSSNQKEALKEKNRFKGILNGIYNFKAKNQFKKLLKGLDKSTTIVHIHGWTKALSSSIFDIAFKKDFKVVLTLHDYFTACPNGGYFDYTKNKICKRKALSLDCIKCNCDSRNYVFKMYRIIRQFVQNKIVKLPKKLHYAIGISELSMNILKPTLNPNVQIRKINNPIEFSEKQEKVNASENKYFLYVGRINKEKGVEIFCKAITKSGSKGIVVGEGSEKEDLEKKYPNIQFTGWKNQEEVKKYILKARCLIFPSLWYEGAPLTPLEAMEYGIPCIVSNCCAAKEYITDGNGYVFDTINELIEKIEKMKDDEICYNASNEAYKFFMNKYEKNYISKLLEFYNNMEN